MKRVFLLGIILILLCGCTSIKNDLFEDIIYNSLNSEMTTKNINRLGYRYYLAKGLSIKESKPYNDVIISNRYNYYLYVDLVSYHNQVKFTYEENPQAYFSRQIIKGDLFGYIEINNYKNNQYLLEIMYNYAKIEVVVYEDDIKDSLAYAMSILASITYNDNVIANTLAQEEFNTTEESFNIFEVIGRENYLGFSDEESEEQTNHDPDYIN